MTKQILTHDHSELDDAMAAAFAALDTGDIGLSFESLDTFWARLAMHIRAENVHLFPTLVQASKNAKASPTNPEPKLVQETNSRLREDHDFFMSELAAALKELRQLQRGQLDDTEAVLRNVKKRLNEVSRRLEVHNALEENQVYDWAAALLSSSEQTELQEKIDQELTKLPSRLREK